MTVIGAIERKNPDSRRLDGVPPVFRPLLATVAAHGIIGNGGFQYWYEGMHDRDTLQAADAFDRLGLAQVADVMRQSLDAFPGRRATPEVLEALDAPSRAAAKTLWETLGPVVWRSDWQRAALRYTLRHADILAASDRDSRHALAELADAWATARGSLAGALSVAAAVDREAVQRAIESDDHHAAHRLLRDAGPRVGSALEFWAAMREVAEQLFVDDRGQSRREHRLLHDGFVLVRVEVVRVNEYGVRMLDRGPARWNLGRRRRLLRTHATELFPIGREEAFPDTLYDTGEVRLVPAVPLATGTAIAIHRDRVLLAHGEVAEIVPGRR
jgi:hypothetical protein